MTAVRWFRDVYRDAVWEDETLSAAEKAVAETYARHARDHAGAKSATADIAWLTYDRLMAKAGIGRRENVGKAIAALVKSGWLVVHLEVSRRPTWYRLNIPGGSDGGTTGVGSSDAGTTEHAGEDSVVPETDHGSSDSDPTEGVGSSDGGTQPSSRPSRPSSSGGPIEALRARLGPDLDDDEAKRLIQRIRAAARGPIRVGFAVYLSRISDEDLAEHRRECAAPPDDQEAEARARRAFRLGLADLEPCEHGEPGGHVQQPGTGWVACVRERRRLRGL